MNRLFLLDAYALIFRAYYALSKAPRITADGHNVSAIFGFVNTLEEILRKEKPSHIAVCFDPQGPTFRSEAYDKYKGDRAATPEDIKFAIPIIKEIIKAYNIPLVEVAGFEADDVIGTIAKMAEQREDFTTYMMTPDKDFGQLVAPNVIQYKPSYRGGDFELRGEKEVCERFAIDNPLQVIDYLALAGDKIDCIPGCPGVGEVTAKKLIHEFGSVESLIENTDRLKGSIKTKVEENKDQILFSKFLATIRTDVPVGLTPEDLVRKAPDREKLFAIFKEFEFKTLIDRVSRRLDSEQVAAPTTPKPASTGAVGSLFDFDDVTPTDTTVESQPLDIDAKLIENTESLDAMQRALLPANECGIFIVSEGENDMEATWLGTAVALADGKCFYIPTTFAEGVAATLDLLARRDICKVTCAAKRDYVMAARARKDGATPLENFFDIFLAHYLLQPDMRHEMHSLAAQYLGLTLPALPAPAAASRAKKPTLDLYTPEQLLQWSCGMAFATLRLRQPLSEAVKADDEWTLLTDVEMPLVEVLAEMELTGVCLDVDALRDASSTLTIRLTNIEEEVYEMAGEQFNIGSPSRVGEILFDRLRLDPKAKKTKTGQYSTSEEVLEKIAHKHPIVAKILEYRQLKKLISTYLDALPKCINPQTGKVHTNYNQTVTATGRISSSNPNLQNIPVRESVGREIRRAFIPSPGNLFLSADYSQIELRLVADFADDETMIDAFRTGKDIHAITAARIYHKDNVEDVSTEQRRAAKTANFGILYGISAFGLAQRLGIPRGEAKELIDNYFATFPTIHRYMEESVEKARENKYAITAMGRKRRLPDIGSRNPVVRGYAERNAINAPVQGSAADIIKVAMIRIFDEMKEKGLKSKMIMQVHDELNFDVVPEEMATLQELVERQMQGAFSGKVPLTASAGIATNWLEAH